MSCWCWQDQQIGSSNDDIGNDETRPLVRWCPFKLAGQSITVIWTWPACHSSPGRQTAYHKPCRLRVCGLSISFFVLRFFFVLRMQGSAGCCCQPLSWHSRLPICELMIAPECSPELCQFIVVFVAKCRLQEHRRHLPCLMRAVPNRTLCRSTPLGSCTCRLYGLKSSGASSMMHGGLQWHTSKRAVQAHARCSAPLRSWSKACGSNKTSYHCY